MTSQADRDIRSQMIAETIRGGVSRSDACEIVDLGAHAFDQALAAAQRVADTARGPNRLPVFVSVLASMATIMRDRFPEHWEAFVAHDTTGGKNTVIIAGDRTGGSVQ